MTVGNVQRLGSGNADDDDDDDDDGGGVNLDCTPYNCCGRLFVFIWTEVWLAEWRLIQEEWVACTQQSCIWYCLCCNIWVCWLGIILVWVFCWFWNLIMFIIAVVWCIVCGIICILSVILNAIGKIGLAVAGLPMSVGSRRRDGSGGRPA